MYERKEEIMWSDVANIVGTVLVVMALCAIIPILSPLWIIGGIMCICKL